MMTRTITEGGGYKAHTKIKAAIGELRRFCFDLKKLAIAGCAGRAAQAGPGKSPPRRAGSWEYILKQNAHHASKPKLRL